MSSDRRPVHADLETAVRDHVRPRDIVHVVCGHSRWTVLARELIRQQWGERAELTLVMVSLGSLGTLFVHGGMVRRVITAYSGDSFPTYGPNPVFQRAYGDGSVEVEHWSILTLAQRLEAAARGLPAVVTGSLQGSAMERNDGFVVVDTALGRVGLLAPLMPDVTLLHAPVADRDGNVAVSPPLLEGLWGAWAARRGVVVSVETVVESLRGLGYRTAIPSHRVLAVVEAPFGAHPGGVFAPDLPVDSYGEDIPFWCEARHRTRSDIDHFARQWVLEPRSHDQYLDRLGVERLHGLRQRADPDSWRIDDLDHPLDEQAATSAWEVAAVHASREVETVAAAADADAVLAGAGVANLAAWTAVARRRRDGHRTHLTAELGLLGYDPTPADPYIFNHRTFPSCSMLGDAGMVLGMVVGGPGTTTVGCLGAAEVDRQGNLNSTTIAGGPFLVGSGGANDVASRAAACVVVSLARPDRLVERVGYITSPGDRVVAVATDLGVLRRHDGELRIAAVAAGATPLHDRVRELVTSCGWDATVIRSPEELRPVGHAEVVALRQFDRERLFLR